MDFFRWSEFQWTRITWKSLQDLKRYSSKVNVFWNDGAVGFQMVKLKKKLSCTKVIMHGGTLLKTVSAFRFSEKPSFWESVSFHSEIFGATKFLIALCICIVNAIIFIKKTPVNLFRIRFYKLLKIINMNILAILTNLWLVFFFFKFDYKFLVIPNFSESALFYREMVSLNFFGLDIDVCNVNSIIFIKKKFTNFFRISFNELLKGKTLLIINIF